jgi:hypothetical protein
VHQGHEQAERCNWPNLAHPLGTQHAIPRPTLPSLPSHDCLLGRIGCMTPFTSVKSRGLCGGLCAAYHLKLHGKDNSSQRGLWKNLVKRKLLLSYLFEIYFDVLQRLNYSTWATCYYALLAILFFLLCSHMIINNSSIFMSMLNFILFNINIMDMKKHINMCLFMFMLVSK